MVPIITRASKGSELEHFEMDANFTELKAAIEAIPTSGVPGQGMVKGFSFLRSATVPPTPVGGSFANPVADLWSDGIPPGTAPIYVVTRLFTSDGLAPQALSWSSPVLLAKDGADASGGVPRHIYSNLETAPPLPANSATTGWSTTPSASTIWMSVQTNTVRPNGSILDYGAWEPPIRIKGEMGVSGSQGAPGSPAISVNLTAVKQSFSYSSAGSSPTPANSIVTATAYNTSGMVYYEFQVNGATVQNTATNTYLYTPDASFSAMPQQITVNIRQGSNIGAVVASDVMPMLGTKPGIDGLNGISSFMSNEAHTVPTDSAGANGNYAGSGTAIRVFEGITELAYDGIGTAAGSWNVTVTATGITAGGKTDSGQYVTIGDHSSMTADAASVNYAISGKRGDGSAFSITKIQTLSKAKQGGIGSPGANGYRSATLTMFKWASSTPTSLFPSGTSTYTWATGSFTAPLTPNGWALAPPPAVAGQTLWAISVVVANSLTTATSDVTWASTSPYAIGYAGTDGANGSAGTNARAVDLSSVAQAFAYDASGANPSPANSIITATARNTSGTVYYEFLVNGVTVQNTTVNTYTYAPQAAYGSMPQQIAVNIREGSNSSTVLATDVMPMIGVKPGASGANGAAGASAISIVVSNSSHTIPTDNAGNNGNYAGSGTTIRLFEGATELSYDGVGTANGSWNVTATGTSITAGAKTDSGVFVTIADHSAMIADVASISYAITGKRSDGTAISVTTIQTLSKSKQGAPGANGANGTNGVNGTRTGILDMYQWSASAPTTFPSGSSTYTWATGQFTAPATTNGWTLTPGAPVAGQSLWICRQIYSDTNTAATSVVTWSATAAISVGAAGSNGANGTNGINGQRVGTLELYQWAATAPTTYPSGTSTYTWASGAFTAPTTPNGWSLTPGAAVQGQTLWGITVNVSDNNTSATSVATWNSSTVYPIGYAGTNGLTGATGASGIALIVSNSAHTIPTDSAGNNGTYTGSGTTIRLFEGASELAYDGIGTANGSWKVVATGASITPGALTDSGLFVTVGDHSAMTADTASVSYAITGKRADGSAISLTTLQTLSKSKQGGTGNTGPQGPAVTITSNAVLAFTSTDTVLDGGQADITLAAATSGISSPTYAWSFVGFQTPPTNSGLASQVITAAQFGTSKAAMAICTVNGTYVASVVITRYEKSTAAAGATVNRFWHAAVDPAAGDGANGDAWLNTATSVWWFKDSGAWTKAIPQITAGNIDLFIANATIGSTKIVSLTADKILSGTLQATESITVGSATNGLVLSGVDATLKVKSSAADRVIVGAISGGTYGISGKRADGTEVFRLDEKGLSAYIKQSVVNAFGGSYRSPVIFHGDVQFTGAPAPAGYAIDNASISAGVITGAAPTGTISVNNKLYGWNASGALLSEDCYVTAVTSQTNFTATGTPSGTGWSIRTGEFSGMASISGTTLTFSTTPTGIVCPGQFVYGNKIAPKTRILSGSGLVWTVDKSQETGAIPIYVNSGISGTGAQTVYIPIHAFVYGTLRVRMACTGYTETRDDTTNSDSNMIDGTIGLAFAHSTARVVSMGGVYSSSDTTDATNFSAGKMSFVFDTAGTIVGIDGSSGIDRLYLKLINRTSTGSTLANTYKTTYSYIVSALDNASSPSTVY